MKKAKTTGSFTNVHFNWKLLLATLLILGTVVGGAFVIHNLQTRSISDEYLRLSKVAEKDGDLNKSREYLERYTRLNPEDAASYADLALLIDSRAKTKNEIMRSIANLAAAIGRCESRDELKEKARLLRRKQAARLYDAERYDDALEQIANCSNSDWDPEQARLLALSRYRMVLNNVPDRWSPRAESTAPDWLRGLAQKHFAVALDEALRSDPGDIELTRALCSVLLIDPKRLKGSSFEAETPAELAGRARSLAASMVNHHKDSAQAWLVQHSILNQISNEEAYATLEQAYQKFPEDRMVLVNMGNHLFQSLPTPAPSNPTAEYLEKLEKAEKVLRASAKGAPNFPPPVALPLGSILMRKDRFDEAMEVWNSGMKGPPPTQNLHFQVINAWTSKGEWEKAEAALKAMDKAIDAESPSLSRPFAQAIAFEGKQRWAEYYFLRRDFEAVIRLLEPLAASSSLLDAEVRAKSISLLANAYMETSQSDKAGNSFEVASTLDPQFAPYKRDAARAWMQASRAGEAMKQLQAIDSKEAEDWLLVAQAAFAIQTGPEPTPDLWNLFDEALREVRAKRDELPPALAVEWRIRQLELLANVARASSEDRPAIVDAAAEELIQSCQSAPEATEMWRRSMDILESWKQRERLAVLRKQFMESHPDCREAVLTKAIDLLKSKQPDAARQLILDSMTKQPDQGLTAMDLLRFCTSHQELESQTGKLLELAGNSLTKTRELGELLLSWNANWFSSPASPSSDATESGKATDSPAPAVSKEKSSIAAIESWSRSLEAIENNLRNIEGEAGTEWKALKARRLMEMDVNNSNRSQLNAVAEIARTLEAQRPLWPITHLVSGNLAERLGDLPAAAKHYRRAISLGAGKLDTFERLISILYRQGSFAEAQQLLKQLGDKAGSSSKLEEFAIRMPGTGIRDSLSLAKSGVESRPFDPMAWVFYGLVIEEVSRNASKSDRDKQLVVAYDAFDRAAQLDASRSSNVLSAELGFYNQLGDREKLEQLYQRIQKATLDDEASRLEIQGRIEMSLGKYDEAESSFKNAMSAGGSRVSLGNQLGKLYLSVGKNDQAIEVFEQLYRDFPEDSEVRKSLATMLFKKGTPEDWERLQAILLEPRNGNETSDRRYLAILRFQRGNPSDLEKAKSLLEDIAVDSTARTDEDSYMLATIAMQQNKKRLGEYASERERFKNTQLAERHFQLATSGEAPDPRHLAAYIDFLIETLRLTEAESKLEKLRSMQPDELLTAVLAARILKQSQRTNEAKEALEQWKSHRISALGENISDDDKATVDAELMLAFLRLEDFESADKQLKAVAELSIPKALDATTVGCRSDSLAARSFALTRLTELLNPRATPENGMQLMRLLVNREFDAEALTKADALILKIQSEQEGNPAFLMSLGNMWLDRKSIDRAIDVYRKVLVADPKNLIAMNNIACLVAEETGRTEESLEMIDKAMEIGGRTPFLLDSKGHILSIAGRHADSIPWFEEAAAKGADPRSWLHLFMALKKSGRTEDAAKIRTRIDLEVIRRLHLSPDEQREVELLSTGRSSL